VSKAALRSNNIEGLWLMLTELARLLWTVRYTGGQIAASGNWKSRKMIAIRGLLIAREKSTRGQGGEMMSI
jgi:hypothetical protein